MIRTLALVVLALALLAGVVVGVRRRTLCTLSVSAGLLAGVALSSAVAALT
jgi:hypothetical protein